MSDLREQLEKMYKCTCIDAYKNRDMIDPSCWGCEFKSAIPDILSLIPKPEPIPKPTVRVKCGECGGHVHEFKCYGQTQVAQCDCGASKYIQDRVIGACPSCTDGGSDHLINWRQPVDEGNITGNDKVLDLPDLIDPDVATAYGIMIEIGEEMEIGNNKGVLRIGEKVK